MWKQKLYNQIKVNNKDLDIYNEITDMYEFLIEQNSRKAYDIEIMQHENTYLRSRLEQYEKIISWKDVDNYTNGIKLFEKIIDEYKKIKIQNEKMMLLVKKLTNNCE